MTEALVRVDNIDNTYDDSGTGMLATRTAGGNTLKFFWQGYNLFLEKAGSTPQRIYFNHPWSLCGTVCRLDLGNGVLDSNDSAYFYLHDEAGNVIAVTDPTGNLVMEYEQDVWGNDLIGNFNTMVGSSPIRQHQNGKFWDQDIGLYYNAARWYDPATGRFISPSPLAPEGEEEYAFCGNDPVNYVDVNGLYAVVDDLTFAGGGALFGLAGQALSDVISGQLSSWEDYVGSALGGAAGGGPCFILDQLVPGLPEAR